MSRRLWYIVLMERNDALKVIGRKVRKALRSVCVDASVKAVITTNRARGERTYAMEVPVVCDRDKNAWTTYLDVVRALGEEFGTISGAGANYAVWDTNRPTLKFVNVRLRPDVVRIELWQFSEPNRRPW